MFIASFFHCNTIPTGYRFALEHKNDKALQHCVHFLHYLVASLVRVATSTLVRSFHSFLDVDVILLYFFSVFVHFIQLFEQVILYVGLDHILAHCLLLLHALLVEHIGVVMDMLYDDCDKRLQAIEAELLIKFKWFKLPLETVVAKFSRKTALRVNVSPTRSTVYRRAHRFRA